MMRRPAAYGAARRLVHRALLALALLGAMPAAAADRLVLAFGDSLTAGYGLPAAQGFTVKLEAALRGARIPVRVYNAGVSGDTTAAARARLGWVLRGVPAPPVLAIVELGANDMLRGLRPAETRTNLDAILAELGRRHIPVLLAGMRAAPNLGRAFAVPFEAIYPDLARAHGARLYPFFLDGVAGQRALVQGDGMHPNARGVDVIVRRIAPLAAAMLR